MRVSPRSWVSAGSSCWPASSRNPDHMIKPRHIAVIAAYVIALTIAVAPAGAQEAPVRVPRSVLERYVGEYDQNGTIIKVSVSGDTLFRETPGQRVVLH